MTTMLTAHDCGCGAAPCDPATQAVGLERTRFFARQLVGPDDLTQDQLYFREKHRRHNRMLHGWGVVCGACVHQKSPCEVVVEPGYVLGPWGDEIVIDREVTIDVCKLGASELSGCCGDELDPWCRDVRADCPDGPLYLAVRYAECRARPVRAPGGDCGCGCGEAACEYSRVRDSFAVKLLRELPAPYTNPMSPPPSAWTFAPCGTPRRAARPCPPCPPEPWVILADVHVARDCRVRSVDCFAHRRYVMSLAEFYVTCQQQGAGGAGMAPNQFPFANAQSARMMAMLSNTSDLVDARAAHSGEPPRATVTLTRADGSRAAVPAYFDVRPGETVADLLAREGDREYYDPATDRAVTLRTIYEGAGVSRETRLTGVASALAALEGRPLRTSAGVAPDAPIAEPARGAGAPAERPAESPTEAERPTIRRRGRRPGGPG